MVSFAFFGALQRSLWDCKGFLHCLDENYFISAIILRTQMDTLMRLNAFRIYPNPHELAENVIFENKKKYMDFHVFEEGRKRKLTDGFLKDQINKEVEWFSRVYDHLSGIVHFSDLHARVTWSDAVDEDRSIRLRLTECDSPAMDHDARLEISNCMLATTKILLGYIKSYFSMDNVFKT